MWATRREDGRDQTCDEGEVLQVEAIAFRIDNLRVFGHLSVEELTAQHQVVEREFARSKEERDALVSARNQGGRLSEQDARRGRQLESAILPRLRQTLAYLREVVERTTPGEGAVRGL